jgi:2-methylcitrate dehydratase PrpD
MSITRKAFLDLASRGTAGSLAVWSAGRSGRSAEASAPAQAGGASGAHRQPTAGVTAAVVRFVDGARIQDMPADVVKEGKRCLIDGLGLMLAGSTLRGSEIIRASIAAVGGKSEASVLGRAHLAAPVAAVALANGASGHAMDFDDTQLSTTPDRIYGLLTHPTIPALAASLAVAERLGASGQAFLEAFLTGFEVECKIAEAIDPDHYQRGFHTSGTVGTFAGATCAAKLMRLSPDVVAHALGIAASLASGIRVNFGTMTKPLHVGRAAENGVVAAQLAAGGFTAASDALDGPWGFFRVFAGGADVERISPVLGKPYTIVDPGVSIKPYPCGVLGHPSMDAMLKLVTDHDVKPDQIQRIRLRAGTNILNPLRYKTAKTELEAKFCPPFMLSSIALRRKAGIHEFTDEFVSSEPVQRMMERVELIMDPAIEAKGFDRIRSIVEVDLKDGRPLVQPSDERYRGGPERPFTRQELRDRFEECAGLVLPPSQIDEAFGAIESIDTLKDIRALVKLLTPSASRS